MSVMYARRPATADVDELGMDDDMVPAQDREQDVLQEMLRIVQMGMQVDRQELRS